MREGYILCIFQIPPKAPLFFSRKRVVFTEEEKGKSKNRKGRKKKR